MYYILITRTETHFLVNELRTDMQRLNAEMHP